MLPISIPLLLHLGLAIGLSLRVLYRKLDVNTTLAWALIIFAVPFVGSVLYLLYGNYHLSRRRQSLNRHVLSHYQQAFHLEAPSDIAPTDIPDRFLTLATAVHQETGFPILANNAYSILIDASDILDRMRFDIDQARTSCSLEFYIIAPEGRIEPLLEALQRAAKRGVSCRILADSFGSAPFFRSDWPQRLKQAGVKVVRSLPVGIIKSISKRSDLRNHRKLLICDQTVCYVGSFNLIDPELFKISSHVGQWVDTMLRIEGKIVDAISCMFNTDYLFDTHTLLISDDDLQRLPQTPPSRHLQPEGAYMQLLPSGPEMPRPTIYGFFVSAIFNARHRIRIVTPYFIPDPTILLALTAAAKRGVRVEIIVPEKLDTWLGQYASQASYEEILSAGIIIQQYTCGLLHTKAILIDAEVCIFGTVNVDTRSFYLNLEISLLMYGPKINQALDKIVDTYVSGSHAIQPEVWARRSRLTRFLENILRLVGPLL